jgi:hypothetical protein
MAIAAVLVACLSSGLGAQEPEEGGSGSSFMDILKEAASEAVGEKMGELTGETRGDITDVVLVERRGNALLLDVKYEDVKRHRDVTIKAEVLYGGEPLTGFANTIAQVTDRKGAARLTIRRDAGGASEDEWGISEGTGEAVSDQLRLYLVRESNPETPFGVLIFDLYKVWTDDDAPEVEEEESVALAEGESAEGTKPGPAFVPSGSKLKPVSPAAAAKPTAAKTVSSATTTQAAASSRPSATLARPMAVTAKPTLIKAGERFDLYTFAARASWKSGAGTLKFPGSRSDAKGFVQTRENGALSPKNTKATRLLLTHPQRVDNGWIEGSFPLLRLPAKASLETILGILYGANASNGAKVSVFVQEPGKAKRRVYRKTVTPQRYEKVRVNLERWAGKDVLLTFRVDAAGSSQSDYVVWVAPRITSER